MDDVAVPVAEDLDFQVPGAADEAFEEDRVVTKRRPGLLTRLGQQRLEIASTLHDSHPPAAAAEGGLDDEREADFPGGPLGGLAPGNGLLQAGNYGHAGLPRQAAGRGFIAQKRQDLRVRTDESDPGLLARPRQGGVLSQKAISGMDGVDSLLPGQRDDLVHVHVGFHRPLPLADLVSLIGLEPVQTQTVLFRIDSHRP